MAERIKWRIIDTGPRDPFTNMAVDEALLRGYELQDSPPTLRIYGWEPAGISIGFSQDAAEVSMGRGAMPVVRRITGGGAIVHRDELTYSLVCSGGDLGPAVTPVVSSYKAISAFLIRFYKSLGLDAAFACDVFQGEKLGAPSTLCFASKEKYDIVVGGRKIGGNAQKRTRENIFQHGSIPITSGGKLPAGSASLEELLGRRPERKGLAALLIDAFVDTFRIEAEEGRMTASEEALCKELRANKYCSDEWNVGRQERPCHNLRHAHPG